MAYTSEMFDQLRDLLNDPTDTSVPFATKKLYLNRGINAMWPRLWRVATDEQITVVDGVRDYSWTPPWSLPSDYFVISVEVKEPDDYRYRINDYDIIPGDEDLSMLFRFTGALPPAGSKVSLRLAAAIPPIAAISYAAAQAESWSGPDRLIGLPVLYAMGMITARKLDDRQDTLRYSTTQATNGVTDQDLMGASQMWFAQFDAEVESLVRPLPPARD